MCKIQKQRCHYQVSKDVRLDLSTCRRAIVVMRKCTNKLVLNSQCISKVTSIYI